MLEGCRAALIQAGFPATRAELEVRLVVMAWVASLAFPLLLAGTIGLNISEYVLIPLFGITFWLPWWSSRNSGSHLDAVGEELLKVHVENFPVTKLTRLFDALNFVIQAAMIVLSMLAIMGQMYIRSQVDGHEAVVRGDLLVVVVGFTFWLCVYTISDFFSAYTQGVAFEIYKCDSVSEKRSNCSPTLSLRVGWHEFRGLQANLRVLKLLGEPKVGYSAYFAGVGEQLRSVV